MTTKEELAEQARPETPTTPPAEDTETVAEATGTTAPAPDAEPTGKSSAESDAEPAEPDAVPDAVPDPVPDAEPDAVPDAEPDEEPGTEPAGERRGGGRFTRAKVFGALAAMLVTAVAATAVLQWVAMRPGQDARAALESERALRLEVSGAASAFSRALLSYDYRDLQTTRSTLAAQATGDFLATYDTAFGGTMAQVIVKLKATSQATVREVYLADVDEATAHAIVVVDQQVNSSQAIRSVRDSHLKISLVKEKGSWKIHDVTALGAASEDQYSLDGDKDEKD